MEPYLREYLAAENAKARISPAAKKDFEVAQMTDAPAIASIRVRKRFARSPHAAGLRMTTVSFIRETPGFDLFFTFGLGNLSAWENCGN